MSVTISQVLATEFIDSRGWPTVGCVLTLSNGMPVRVSVPAGASVGEHEAPEKRDGDPSWYCGRGVSGSVAFINDIVAPTLIGKKPCFEDIDRWLIAQKVEVIGANTTLAVSNLITRAQAIAAGVPLWRFLADYTAQKPSLPRCMANILNGGAHATNGLAMQELMIVPPSVENMTHHVHSIASTYHALKRLLFEKGLGADVGDEGGFAPLLPGSAVDQVESGLNLVSEAIECSGQRVGKELFFACDVAASELYDSMRAQYNRAHFQQGDDWQDATGMIAWYQALAKKWPLISVEDGLDQNDWSGWRALTHDLGGAIQIVGDDIFVTNQERLVRGTKEGVANSILIKPNQIGTVSQTLATIKQAQAAGYAIVVSHRSGETNDSFIADLAVGVGAEFIKLGAPCRGERTAKYNRLIAIAGMMK